jgi:hypothetical protein
MEPSQVARARLRNSGLNASLFNSPPEVVRAHGGMQAQDYGPTKWSIGQRLRGATADDVEAHVSSGSIIRTHVLRPTWHFVAAEDLRWMLRLTGPRVQRGMQSRYHELGLGSQTLARARRAIAKALAGGVHLTRREVSEVLVRSRIDPAGQRLPHILGHCELEGLICSGAPRGKQQTFALIDERVAQEQDNLPDDPIVELVLRYFSSHGPATMKDLRWWSSLTIKEIRAALEALEGQIVSETINDIVLWYVPNGRQSSPRKGTAHLLQTYDETVVGYTESRYFGDPREKQARAAFTDRNLPTGIVLLDDRILGLWRRETKPRSTTIDVRLYERPDQHASRALDRATKRLSAFTGVPVDLQVTRIASSRGRRAASTG